MKEHRESPAGNSQLKLYATCPRKWAWKYYKGFKSGDKSEPLNLGSAIHEAQEVFYLTGDLAKAEHRGAQILLDVGWDKESEVFIYQRFFKGIQEWVRLLGQSDYDRGIVKEVEKEYKLHLPNDYIMTVRVDSLMDDPIDGLYIRDTKTTKRSASMTIQQYMYDPQPILYIAALRQNGVDVMGWKTDAIAMSVLKAGPKADVIRSGLVCPTDDTVADVLDAYADITYSILGSVEFVEDNGWPVRRAFPKNPLSCYNYFKPCPYYSICHSIDEVEEPTLGFELDPWLSERKVLNTFKEIT